MIASRPSWPSRALQQQHQQEQQQFRFPRARGGCKGHHLCTLVLSLLPNQIHNVGGKNELRGQNVMVTTGNTRMPTWSAFGVRGEQTHGGATPHRRPPGQLSAAASAAPLQTPRPSCDFCGCRPKEGKCWFLKTQDKSSPNSFGRTGTADNFEVGILGWPEISQFPIHPLKNS